MPAIQLILALVFVGVSASLSKDQQKTGFSHVHMQGQTNQDVKEQDLKTLVLQQSAVIEQQSVLMQKQAAAIQTFEAKVAALENQGLHPLVKRSDDVSVGALQALVQQQAAAIQTLQAKVTSLEDKESQTETKVTGLDSQARKQVAFSASFTEDGTSINIGQNSPLQFNHVVTNVGNGYDQHTGIFRAPSSGLYAFFMTMRSHSTTSSVVVAGIVKTQNQETLCRTSVEGLSHQAPWDKGSCFATVHLRQGDQIHVQRVGGHPIIDKGWESGFSGVLVSADL